MIRVTGVKQGNTNVQVTAGKVKYTLPASVYKSPNLLSYGPITTPINGYTIEVNTDGSLLMSGTNLPGGKGICWPLDTRRLTAGVTYTVSMQESVPEICYPAIRVESGSTAKTLLAHIPAGQKTMSITPTEEQLAKGLLFGFSTFQASGGKSFTPVTVRPMMLKSEENSVEWTPPDTLNAIGGGVN